jgi:putative nucleotidyltransferase with HDIG domain
MRRTLIRHSSPPRDDGVRSISPFRGTPQGLVVTVDAPPEPDGRLLGAYAIAVALLAAAVATWLAVSWSLEGATWVLIPLAILAIAAERGNIRFSKDTQVSISLLPTLFAAVIFGPIGAMIVGAASLLGDFRPPYLKWAIYTCTRAVNGAITGLSAYYLAEAASGSQVGSIALATFGGAVTVHFLDILFAALTGWVRGLPPHDFLRIALPVLPSAVLVNVAIAAPLALAYTELSPWTALLFLFPALAAQRLFAMYQEQRRLATDLVAANESLERANLSFASALVTTLDARDRYTAGHSAAVAVYSRDIAGKLGLPAEICQLAHLSGLLHDIGKIGVPPGVLEKNGPLTLHERRLMEEHSVTGERILANVEAYAEIALIVRHHHERIDGQGYPDGIVGDSIPLISRIICVADAYNAMTSDRPYRDAMTVEVARARLLQAAETQFDPTVVATFDAILEEAGAVYSSGAGADFAVEAQAHPELAVAPAVTAA